MLHPVDRTRRSDWRDLVDTGAPAPPVELVARDVDFDDLDDLTLPFLAKGPVPSEEQR